MKGLTLAGLIALATAIPTTQAELFQCRFAVDGVSYDLSTLGGGHKILVEYSTPPSRTLLSWFINPCGVLPDGFSSCDKDTQVCGTEEVVLEGSKNLMTQIIPLVSKADSGGSSARLVKIDGGVSTITENSKWGDFSNLTSRIDFVCSDADSEPTMKSWDGQLLHVEWKTKQICTSNDKPDQGKEPGQKEPDQKEPDQDKEKEPPKGDEPADESSSWGWFTWLFIILVLVFGGYVIGSAWINYNQYGMSGVELLPHSDALRDLPYLIRDFANKVVNTFAGGGTRGGYSAV